MTVYLGTVGSKLWVTKTVKFFVFMIIYHTCIWSVQIQFIPHVKKFYSFSENPGGSKCCVLHRSGGQNPYSQVKCYPWLHW